MSKLAHLGLVQFKSGRGGIQNRRNLANQYHPNFWIFIDPFSGRFVVPEYGLPMYEWRTVAGYFRARLETGENPGNGTTLPNESAFSR